MTSSLDMIRGRSNVVTLTNNSGGALVEGDVCVQDTSADEKVTTTTSAASTLKVFVAAESIAAGAAGKFYESGYCRLVNVNASVTCGRFLFTHTVAKQAAESATYGSGAFGKILKSGTTPSAILYSATAQISGSGVTRSGSTTDGNLAVWNGNNADSIKDGGAPGGAPTTAKYVTTAADGGLSAEVVIPGLAGSPDIAGAGGAGTAQEFDTITDPFTYAPSAPNTHDCNTTIKSHYYVKQTGDNTIRSALAAWSPAGAFDARCKVLVGSEEIAAYWSIALCVLDSGGLGGAGGAVLFGVPNSAPKIAFIDCYTISGGTLTQRGARIDIYGTSAYLRLTRDGSNNLSFYYSDNGLLWYFIATQALTFTAANIGFRFGPGDSANWYAACDWLRTDV